MLNVVETGNSNNPTLVLLHGLGGTHRYWNTGLESISRHYHVVRVDLLGFGDSPRPWQNYTQNKHLAAVETVLTNYDNFVLAGHSLGAAISLVYAQQHPQQVKGLVLISLPLFENQPYAYRWMRRTPSGWLLTNMAAAGFACIATRRLAKKLLPYFLKEFPPEVVSDLVKHNVFSSITTLWNVLYNQSITADLNLLNPNLAVQCIHAINDATAPYQAVEQLVNSQASWTMTKLDDSDHHPWLWDNQVCIQVIMNAMADSELGSK